MLDYFMMLKTRKMLTKKLPRVLIRKFGEPSREWLFKELWRTFDRMAIQENLENLGENGY